MENVGSFPAYCDLHFWPAFPSNRDCVKLEPQLCMNQNNNPQRQFLTPFPDTLCDSSSVESCTLENPLRLIASPDTPTEHAEELRRAAPVLPGAPDCWCVRACVCSAALKGDDLDKQKGHRRLVCISELPGWRYHVAEPAPSHSSTDFTFIP